MKETEILTKTYTITLQVLSPVPTILEDPVYSNIQIHVLTNSTDDACHTDFVGLRVNVQLTHVLQIRHCVGCGQLLTLAIVDALLLHLLHVNLQQRKRGPQMKMQ